MTQLTYDPFPGTIYDSGGGGMLSSAAPSSNCNVSASIPIRARITSGAHGELDVLGIDSLGLELMAVTGEMGLDDTCFGACGGYDDTDLGSPSLWSPSPTEDVKESDFLPTDKSDPTLAELNLDRRTEQDECFDSLDCCYDMLSTDEANLAPIDTTLECQKSNWEPEKSATIMIPQQKQQQENLSLKPQSLKTNTAVSTSVPPIPRSYPWYETASIEKSFNAASIVKCEPVDDQKPPASTLHELLTQQRAATKVKPPPLTLTISCKSQAPPSCRGLSSSAPTQGSLEHAMILRHHQSIGRSRHSLDENQQLPRASSVSSSTGDLLSPKEECDSHDEGFDSEQEDTDHYDELSSDAESTTSDYCDVKHNRSPTHAQSAKNAAKERFFWQYNVQAKGPKINRLCMSPRKSDPHHLNEVTDPVFSPGCYVQGIKHSGKARRGDGNDLTPNPRKLYSIGQELRKLNRVINDLTPVSELPFSVRPKSRKEKNKLASRACRLKKKAQHEANKLKLYGLEQEHKKLLTTLKESRKMIVHSVEDSEAGAASAKNVSKEIEHIIKTKLTSVVAGHTSEYVNLILDTIVEGNFEEEDKKDE